MSRSRFNLVQAALVWSAVLYVVRLHGHDVVPLPILDAPDAGGYVRLDLRRIKTPMHLHLTQSVLHIAIIFGRRVDIFVWLECRIRLCSNLFQSARRLLRSLLSHEVSGRRAHFKVVIALKLEQLVISIILQIISLHVKCFGVFVGAMLLEN